MKSWSLKSMNNLSDIFKFISHYRHAGHQVGRKVGDMLEVLTYAALSRNPELLSRLHVEPRLYGFSDAGHKVEFVLHSSESFDSFGLPQIRKSGSIIDPYDVISFIECKKVGVEQTINGNFKRLFTKCHNSNNYVMPYESEYTIRFAPRGQDSHTFRIITHSDKTIDVTKEEDREFSFHDTIYNSYRLIFALSDRSVFVIGNEGSLRGLEGCLEKCKILEIATVESDHITAILNDCLAGPQTPEKAKQASFVALDVRKKRFNSFDKRVPEVDMVSVLVLTEYAHWEQKSLNMIHASIDKNLVVEDAIIVEAMIAFNDEFGESYYDMITKDNFESNSRVKNIVMAIVNKHGGKIFKDLEDNTYKRFDIANGLFVLM